MSSEPRITVEPAGRSEADWSSAPLSSAGLPGFVEGEFTHMVELSREPATDREPETEGDLEPLESGVWGEEDSPSEQERIAELSKHMTALLEVIGKDREVSSEGIAGLLGRFWGGEQGDR